MGPITIKWGSSVILKKIVYLSVIAIYIIIERKREGLTFLFTPDPLFRSILILSLPALSIGYSDIIVITSHCSHIYISS